MGDKVLLTVPATVALLIAMLDFITAISPRYRQERELLMAHAIACAIVGLSVLAYLIQTRGSP